MAQQVLLHDERRRALHQREPGERGVVALPLDQLEAEALVLQGVRQLVGEHDLAKRVGGRAVHDRQALGARVVVAGDALAEHRGRDRAQVDVGLDQPEALEHRLVGPAAGGGVGAVEVVEPLAPRLSRTHPHRHRTGAEAQRPQGFHALRDLRHVGLRRGAPGRRRSRFAREQRHQGEHHDRDRGPGGAHPPPSVGLDTGYARPRRHRDRSLEWHRARHRARPRRGGPRADRRRSPPREARQRGRVAAARRPRGRGRRRQHGRRGRRATRRAGPPRSLRPPRRARQLRRGRRRRAGRRARDRSASTCSSTSTCGRRSSSTANASTCCERRARSTATRWSSTSHRSPGNRARPGCPSTPRPRRA